MIKLKARIKKLKNFKIPVCWEVGAFMNIQAETIEEAIKIAEDADYLPMWDADYVDGSFTVIEEVAREINQDD